MNSYVAVDLETTGFSSSTCDIIEIGAWKVKDGIAVAKFSTLVRPIVYIPRNVQEMTGITMDMVAECETIEPVLAEFFDWCEDLPFLGYNLPFDFNFLVAKGKPLGLDFTLKNLRTGIDVLELVKKVYNFESNKLVDVCKELNINIQGNGLDFHRAVYDAYMTKLIYEHIFVSHPNVSGVKLPKMLVHNDIQYGTVTNTDTLSFE